MNKINELKEKLIKEHTHFKIHGHYYGNGFDAAMDLQLPVLFAIWKDENCIKEDGVFVINDGLTPVTWTYEELYKYYLENIYQPEPT